MSERAHLRFTAAGEVAQYELGPATLRPFLAHEEEALAGLSGRAWERREDPEALRVAVAAIEDWFDRRHVRRYERQQRTLAAVLTAIRTPLKEWLGSEPPAAPGR